MKPEENRMKFIGSFDHVDRRHRSSEQVSRSLLLYDIREAVGKQLVVGHLWLRPNKPFDDLHLKYGDRVVFDAPVIPYVYQNGKRDYRLVNPMTVEAISRYRARTTH